MDLKATRSILALYGNPHDLKLQNVFDFRQHLHKSVKKFTWPTQHGEDFSPNSSPELNTIFIAIIHHFFHILNVSAQCLLVNYAMIIQFPPVGQAPHQFRSRSASRVEVSRR